MSDRGLADTSFFVAAEAGREFRTDSVPEELAISAVTIGELRAGVLAAVDAGTRDRRLSTLLEAVEWTALPINEAVAEAWARLRIALRDSNLRMDVNDSWIAATALAHDIPVVTQDAGFVEIGGLRVIRI